MVFRSVALGLSIVESKCCGLVGCVDGTVGWCWLVPGPGVLV